MNFIKLTFQTVLKNESIIKTIISPQLRFFQSSQSLLFAQNSKTQSSETIRLYDENGKVIGHKTKQEAETIAKKNGFALVAMEILGKPKFPEYQLKPRHKAFSMEDETKDDTTIKSTDNQNAKESKKTPNTSKDIKRITFETSIASNDLKIKMDQINRWIDKGKEIHITIAGSRSVPLDTFSSRISPMFSKDVRFLVNKQKGNNIKMIVDKKPMKDSSPTDQPEDEPDDEPANRKQDSSNEPKNDLTSDEYLLTDEAEFEKFLKKGKKLK
ncbi:uncharacterized protein LOC128389504 [Panonychus citri]|uniref:uncharacterized protein LOC128389504 n=1 Tax=Panonychus citri TaxID=50023 RepID=UPI002306FA18|nr:uncharacterized protein LOC128389504 [Panonychus citri]